MIVCFNCFDFWTVNFNHSASMARVTTMLVLTLMFYLSVGVSTTNIAANRTFYIQEERAPGALVGNIGDGLDESLQPPYQAFFFLEPFVHETFDINYNDGVIKTRKKLDREKTESYTFFITKDAFVIQVIVNVTDINDNYPTFTNSTLYISIPENAPNHKVSLGSAVDMDIGNNTVGPESFRLVSGNDDYAFNIAGRKVGNHTLLLDLRINGTLDYEITKFYDLLVEVFDYGSPPKVSKMNVHISIEDANDNHPVFNQSKYSAAVLESATTGTSVLQVFATDQDDGENKRVFYAIQRSSNEEGHFAINRTTGEITVLKLLDYEVKKKYDLTIVASDNGTSPTQSTAAVEIDVINVNELPANISLVFLTNETARIPENARIGDFVVRISVSDPDAPDVYNNNISVVLQGGQGDFGLQTTDNVMYLMVVTGTLDRETTPFYNITLIATDSGSPPLSDRVSFQLFVTDINNNAPQFNASHYYGEVQEMSPPGSSVLRVYATDRDIGDNARVQYFLQDSSSTHSDWFEIDRNSGLITTQGPVDCEVESEPTFIVVAKDGGTPPLSSSVMVTVAVRDVNDKQPMFDQSLYLADVPENWAVDTNILQVSARDPDCGVNGDIVYLISNQSTAALQSFYIEPVSGKIRIKKALDHEGPNKIYDFTVTARDSGGLETTAQVRISIKDVNDNTPVFYPYHYGKSIQQDTPTSVEIITVKATDQDSGSFGEIRYSLLRNDENLFKINETSGAISLARTLPSGEREYTLRVNAVDGGNQQTGRPAEVLISVVGPNYNPPTFERPMYRFSVREDVNEDTPVGSVMATFNGGSQSAEIHYSIVDGDQHGFFRIDLTNGTIYTAKQLDHDEYPSVLLNVMATVGSASDGGTTQVDITVEDVNDNAPVFSSTFITTSVLEEIQSNEIMYVAHATDKDSPINGNGEVKYRLLRNPEGMFAIDQASGEIHLAEGKKLDYETRKSYELTISAYDQGRLLSRSSNMTLVIQVQDSNDNAPVFSSPQPSYSVNEAEEPTAKLFQIVATDKDAGENARITYSLMDSPYKEKFGIFPNDGYVYLKDYVDREEKAVYVLTVVAQDHGHPAQSASREITIVVEDSNDNAPEFLHSEYTMFVEENQRSGTLVGRVEAADRDIGKNAVLKYSFISTGDPFEILQNGAIKTTQNLDRENVPDYTLQVRVEDSGEPSKEAACRVKVIVMDVNDNVPVIVNSEFVGQVAENQAKGLHVVQVFAEDKDAGDNGTIRFSFQEGENEEVRRLFAIDPRNGWIKTLEVLDFETKSNYTLTVKVTDGGSPPLSSSQPFKIRIIDDNEEAPIFHHGINETYYIVENTPINTVVGRIEAYDRDGGENGRISYFINGGNTFGLFAINQETGDVYTIREIDYEEASSHRVGIKAIDNSVYKPMSNSITIKINVIDVNDNAPVFEKDPVFLRIRENLAVDTVVHTFTASDADSSVNGTVRYQILNQDLGLLKIDEVTGQLSVARNIDYESVKAISLIVQAYDLAPVATSRHFTDLTVSVFILDENDNAPVFQHYADQDTLQVTENEPVGYRIASIIAVDFDSNVNNSGNNVVVYNMAPGNLSGNIDNAFHLDRNSGVLSVARELDRETTPSYSLEIWALDQGSPRLASQLTLTVKVLDVNDNAPHFVQSTYKANVTEGSPAGTIVTTIRATDRDEGLNGQLTYNIPDGIADNQFTVHSTTGVVTTRTDTLDREMKGSYIVTAYVQDAGTPIEFDMATIIVNISDINDQSPVFKEQQYHLKIPENKHHTAVHTFVAFDGDIGVNAKIAYSIRSGNVGQVFSIDRDLGVLSCVELDRETKASYDLEIAASDGKHTTQCMAMILVTDLNDNDPVFLKEKYETLLFENVPVGTHVVNVTAHDADDGKNGEVTYGLGSDSDAGLFRINNVTGEISTSGTFDWEKQKKYTFDVIARDGGQNDQRSQRVQVVVSIGDVNDNAPVFKQIPYKKQVPRTSVRDQHVLKVIAEDKDDGQNGEVVYSLLPDDSVTQWFRIERTSGDIYITQDFTDEAVGYHNLEVLAKDLGTSVVFSSTGVVEITVGDDSEPTISFKSQNYEASIAEHSETGTYVATVELQNQVVAAFSFASGNEGNAFQISSQGRITVSSKDRVDYETAPSMRLVVEAKSANSLYAYTTVTVTVTDINDQRPIFTQDRYITKVEEEQQKGTYVTQVMAVDLDSPGPNSDVTYNIIRGNKYEAFALDSPHSGIIVTNVIVDYEVDDAYKLVIEAVDNGDRTLSSTCVLKITVIDTNDNPPNFPTTQPVVTISEGTVVGSQIKKVTASDQDTSPELIYNMTNNPDGMFSIDQFSAIIRLAKPLDHERRNHYVIPLEVTDGVHQDFTKLTVYVGDENDNAPQFSQQSYQVTVEELTGKDTSVIQVNATDADSGENAEISYHLAMSSPDGFYINSETGIIYTSKVVEYQPSQQIVQLVVTAEDRGHPALSGDVVVHIQVTSINQHAPVFDETSYMASLYENSERGMIVEHVSATDSDDGLGPNQEILYKIVSGNYGNMFSIDQKLGRIILNGNLDRESTPEYYLTVMAQDRGTPPKTSAVNALINVKVLDINDQTPYFEKKEYYVELNESYPSEQVFARVRAFDMDEGNNSKLYYTITSGNDDGIFIVDGGNGEMVIMPKAHLDYERQTLHKLVVKVIDSGVPRLSNITTVIVSVTDINEFKPEFPVELYIEGLQEHLPVGSPVFEAYANDKDAGPYGIVRYSILGSNVFNINSSSGLVTSTETYDYESAAQHQFRFQVVAMDTGGLSSSVSVIVNLADKDEYEPAFDKPSYSFSVPGSAKNGTSLGYVRATDQDGGDAGRVVYTITPPSNYFRIDLSKGELLVKHDLNREVVKARNRRDVKQTGGFEWLESYVKQHGHRSKRSTSDLTSLQIQASSGMEGSQVSVVIVEVDIDRSCPHCEMIYEPTVGPPEMPEGLQTTIIVIIVVSVIAVVLAVVIVLILLRNRFRGKSPPPSEVNVYSANSEDFDTLPTPTRGSGRQTYRGDIIRFGGNTNSANVTSSSDISDHSHNSGSSGRGSAEDDEDEEIRMINSGSPYLNNSNGFRKAMPDSGIQDDDNTSEPSVQNHQDYLARLGIDTAKINSKAKSGLTHSVESMHQFSDSGGGEGNVLEISAPVDYNKLGAGQMDSEVTMLDKHNDMGFHEPEPHIQASLTNVINSEEEYSGSYNWDYLLDWGPQYQPLAHVFAEIARLKDDTIQPKKQPVQIIQQRTVSMNPQVRTVPPPMITNAPPKVTVQPRSNRSSHSSGSQANSARTSTMNTSLPSMPRSPISHESSFTSPALTPSFTPSLSPLATRSPSISPVNSGRVLISSNHSSGINTPRGPPPPTNNNKYGFSSSSAEQELRI